MAKENVLELSVGLQHEVGAHFSPSIIATHMHDLSCSVAMTKGNEGML